jgi:hypothetical protein
MHTPDFQARVQSVHRDHAASSNGGLRAHFQDLAAHTVLLQVETLCKDWAA